MLGHDYADQLGGLPPQRSAQRLPGVLQKAAHVDGQAVGLPAPELRRASSSTGVRAIARAAATGTRCASRPWRCTAT